MSDAEAFERCMAVGGVAVFPADTVYGLACDPDNRFAVERLYLLKRRALDKPSAVMFFDVDLALAALPELGERTRTALRRLLPGGVTPLLPNPAEQFPLACGADRQTLGLRVPALSGALRALAGVQWPVLQSSANRAGGRDPRRLEEVPELIRAAADLVLDGGELPGTPSTVVDLRPYEADGTWEVVRAGAVPTSVLEQALRGQFHFDPDSYLEMMHAEVPAYETLQDVVARESAATPVPVRRILELGTGTGETAARLLALHSDAELVGIDASAAMLAHARERVRDDPAGRVELVVGRLEDPLPPGPFDVVASALAVHHLHDAGKRRLFGRVRAALRPGGRFVLGDVVVPVDAAAAQTPLTPGFDRPSTLADQLAWLIEAGFDARAAWEHGDLAVLVADARSSSPPSTSPAPG